MEVTRLDSDDLRWRAGEFDELLRDAVDSGASIGFLPPLMPGEAGSYWQNVAAAMRDGSRVLLAAFDEGHVVGCVQVDYASRRNAQHRAEVMKLMVHTSARRKGVGRALMSAAAEAALRGGRTLLVLDTRQGDPSERLYRSLGYESAGIIPGYARSASGELHATVFMYKQL
jgi:acetyltransferase